MCVSVCLCCISERPRYTAARECYEETLGILGDTDHLASLLGSFAENNVFEVSKSQNWDKGHVRDKFKFLMFPAYR